MSNPVVKAELTAEDKMTQVIRAAAEQIQRLGREFGRIAEGDNLSKSLSRANNAANVHLNTLGKNNAALREMLKTGSAYAAINFAASIPNKELSAIHKYEPVERELVTMKAAGGFSDEEMKGLRAQHLDLAKTYGEMPESTAQAQAEFVKRHMSAQVTAEMTKQAAILAKATGTDIATAAKMLESAIFARGEHVETVEDAKRLGPKYSDLMTVAAKKGAMSADDLKALNE